MNKLEFSKLKEYEKVNYIKREMSLGCSLSKVSTEIGLHKQAVKKVMERNKYLFIDGKFTPNKDIIEVMETIGSDNISSSNVEIQNSKIRDLEERIEKLEALVEAMSSKEA